MTRQSRELFVCELCGYIADRGSILADIGRGIQLKLRSYKCEECRKTDEDDFIKQETIFISLTSETVDQHEASATEKLEPNSQIDIDESEYTDVLGEISPVKPSEIITKNQGQNLPIDQGRGTHATDTVKEDLGDAEDTNKVATDSSSEAVGAVPEGTSPIEEFHENNNAEKIDEFWSYEEIAFACKSCRFSGDSESCLTKHIAESHNQSSLQQSMHADGNSKTGLTDRLKSSDIENSLLKCHDCSFVSGSAKELINHTKSVHNWSASSTKPEKRSLNKPKRRCQKCDYVCKTFRELWKHGKNAHNSKSKGKPKSSKIYPLKCSGCDYTYERKRELFRHITNVHPDVKPEGKIKCPECKFECFTQLGIQRHVNVVHLKRKRKYEKGKSVKCSDCNVVCNGKRLLSRHALDVHQKVLNINTNPRAAQRKGKTNLVKDKLCQFCPYSTAYESDLKSHLNGVHLKERIYKCHLCEFSCYYPAPLKQHKETVHCQTLKCNLCMYTFQSKEVLNHHTKLVHDAVKVDLKCEYCTFEADDVASLDLHLKEAHIDIAVMLKCNQCPFSTHKEETLRVHCESVHERKLIKVSTCSLCTRTVKGKHDLKIHWKQVHGKIQVDLQCQKCSLEAKDVEGIEEHYRKSHTKNAELKTCQQCQFSSYHEPTLDAHQQSVHEKNRSAYEENQESVGCHLCSFVAVSAKYLKQHMTMTHDMRSNSETESYRCYLCLQTFTQKNNIRRHIEKVHYNILVDLKCTECNFEFKDLQTVEAHYKETHSISSQLNSCDKCQFSSYHDPALKAHIKTIHGGLN